MYNTYALRTYILIRSILRLIYIYTLYLCACAANRLYINTYIYINYSRALPSIVEHLQPSCGIIMILFYRHGRLYSGYYNNTSRARSKLHLKFMRVGNDITSI